MKDQKMRLERAKEWIGWLPSLAIGGGVHNSLALSVFGIRTLFAVTGEVSGIGEVLCQVDRSMGPCSRRALRSSHFQKNASFLQGPSLIVLENDQKSAVSGKILRSLADNRLLDAKLGHTSQP